MSRRSITSVPRLLACPLRAQVIQHEVPSRRGIPTTCHLSLSRSSPHYRALCLCPGSPDAQNPPRASRPCTM